MKRQEQIEKLRKELGKYAEYAILNNAHQIPKKGINSGSDGRLYEPLVKLSLGNYRFNGVAKAGYTDTRKLGELFEIKQGCGELGVIDEKGEIVSSVFSKDMIIYAPDYRVGDDVRYVSWVFTTTSFFQALESCGLIRVKTSSYMNRRKQEGMEWYPDRIAIQSYKNSRKKFEAWQDAMEKYGKPLDEWLEENCIKSIEL